MKHILFSFLALLILASCDSGSRPVILAKNIEDDGFGEWVTLFEMDHDNHFTLSFIPNDPTVSRKKIISGNYYIKNDTIYFTKNDKYRKAILKNGYVEFLGNYRKIKLITNNSTIQSTQSKIDYSDFSFLTYSPQNPQIFDSGTNVDLNQSEINRLKSLIQIKMSREKNQFSKHSKESEYNKQCISIRNKKGEKIVWVNCSSKKARTLKSRWHNELITVDDGGEYYFNLKINLSTSEVFDFYVNGNA